MSISAALSRHSAHLVAFGLPALAGLSAVVAVEMNERRARSANGAVVSRRSSVVWAAALASMGAGVVHAAVCPDHFREATLYGEFFLGAAAAQICWSVVALLHPTRNLWHTGVGLHGSIVALWAVTRTTGLPVGPLRWTPEASTGIDRLAVMFELAAFISCISCLCSTPASRDRSRPVTTSSTLEVSHRA